MNKRAGYSLYMQTQRAHFQTHLFLVGSIEIAPHKNLMPCVIFGRGNSVVVEGNESKVKADIVCIKPDIRHRVKVDKNGAYIMYFDGIALNKDQQDFQRIDHSWQHVPEALRTGDNDTLEQFRCVIGRNDPPPDPQIMQIVDELYLFPFNRMSQDQLANRLGLERTQALRHFKAVTGQTFRKFKIWAASIAAARSVHHGQAIGLAGLDAGFSDPAHTSRTAMAIFGMTPTYGLSRLIDVSTVS